MSLINDALKRANQSQKERAQATPPPAAPPLQPVEQAPAGGSPQFLVPVLLALVLAVAAWVFWKWWQVSQSPNSAGPAASSQLASAKTEPSETAPPAAHRLKAPADIQINTNPVVRPGPISEAPSAAGPGASQPTASSPAPTPSSPTPASVPAATPVAPAPPAASPTPAETAAVKRAFPELKLQAIFYRLRSPSVMINDQTLYRGDEVEGAKVIRIERQTVTVEFQGEQKVLRMR